MKTDDLIDLLARQPAAATPRAAPAVAQAALLGVLGSLAIFGLGYGVRQDIAQAVQWPMFWLKLLLPFGLAVIGGVLVSRLGRPGAPAGRLGWGVPVALLGLWAMAAAQWLGAEPAARPALLWGQTWRSCAASIGLIALPTFVAALAALRDLAPTRPRAAGAAAGLLAGGAGAAVYALHCPELAAPFLAVWYVLGMALPVAVGAWLGPRVLRW